MTNVPVPTLGNSGYIVPEDSATLAGVQADLSQAFGGNLNPAVESPQGQLAVIETSVIARFNALLVANDYSTVEGTDKKIIQASIKKYREYVIWYREVRS